MDALIDFDINESLKLYLDNPQSISTPEAPSNLQECESSPEEHLTTALANHALNPVVDAITQAPEAILRCVNFDTLQFLLRFSAHLAPVVLSKLFDLIVSALGSAVDAANGDIEGEEALDGTLRDYHKRILECYAFLLQWCISTIENKAMDKTNVAVGRAKKTGRGKGKGKDTSGESTWDPSPQLLHSMEAITKTLRLRISKIFEATSERDTFIALFTRPMYLLLENEARVKDSKIRMHIFKVLCVSVKYHGHSFGAQTSIIQNLSYFEHLSEPMAEFLFILLDQYDHAQLTEDILRELSSKQFNSNDTKGPRSVAVFITKLSELAPKLVMRQMTVLAKFLDNDAYTLRCAIIEVCGNLITTLSREAGETGNQHKGQISRFFDVLEERFLDINPYCRCRAIQVFARLTALDTKFPKRRQVIADLTERSLEDKSSHVRRNAIKLLAKLVATHPFSALHGSQLKRSEWEARLKAVDHELERLRPSELAERERSNGEGSNEGEKGGEDEAGGEKDEGSNAGLLDEGEEKADLDAGSVHTSTPKRQSSIEQAEDGQKAGATEEEVGRLQLTRRYYTEALRFIDTIHEASTKVMALLSSRNKSELIEAMDFFVVLDAFKMETARKGIRNMLRLVWTKGSSDDGKGVQAHLIDCYKALFFDAPSTFTESEAATFVARNMISLTFGATPAELASLEQLLSTMARAGTISDSVVAKLWLVYGVGRDISRAQRCGAAIVLSMLALARPEIVAREMESCLRIGLGAAGARDNRLARFTCVALGRVGAGPGSARLPPEHPVLDRLAAVIIAPGSSPDWFGMAEQAISAIYALAKFPDMLCGRIIRTMTRRTFQDGSSGATTPVPKDGATDGLAQLLFVVGHVAVKQLVHLDLIEHDFKRRKAEKEAPSGGTSQNTMRTSTSSAAAARKRRSLAPSAAEDELDLMAGTTEDDFSDAIAAVREQELLGPTGLLGPFGAIAAEVCAHPRRYPHRRLQIHASLCLAKLMCVSSEFCNRYLGLLLTVLERSEDGVIRSNVVIGLGDLAVSFNHLLDENTDFLYRRLTDRDVTVKHTCLVTLTFLILAGQVKVKGQLGEMAKCVTDGDARIADLAQMFFTELATKDNAVYNHFTDMFSLLSADRSVPEETFRRIMRFLLGFVEKDKYAKQLAARLAGRLEVHGVTERQRADVAFVLGVLQQTHQLALVQEPTGPEQPAAAGAAAGEKQGEEKQEKEEGRARGSRKRTARSNTVTSRLDKGRRAKKRARHTDLDQGEDEDEDEEDGEEGELDEQLSDQDEGSEPDFPNPPTPEPKTGRAAKAAQLRHHRKSLRAARKSLVSSIDELA